MRGKILYQAGVLLVGILAILAAIVLSNPWREYSAFYKTGMNRHNF